MTKVIRNFTRPTNNIILKVHTTWDLKIIMWNVKEYRSNDTGIINNSFRLSRKIVGHIKNNRIPL